MLTTANARRFHQRPVPRGYYPLFASLIDPNDPNDPVRKQVVPTADEIQPFTGRWKTRCRRRHSPVPGLVHRYPDRVLMLVTTQCASYCRFCTRSRSLAIRRLISRMLTSTSRSTTSSAPLRCGCTPFRRRPADHRPGILEELLRRLREIPTSNRTHRYTRACVYAHARNDSYAICCRNITAVDEHSRQPSQ